MGVGALVPVEEALGVDGLTDLQILDCIIDVGGVVAEVAFHGEGVGLAIAGDVEVQVIAVRAGAVVLVQESSLVAVAIGAGFHGQ